MKQSETIYIDADDRGQLPIAEVCNALTRVKKGTSVLYITLPDHVNANHLMHKCIGDFPGVQCSLRSEEKGPMKQIFHVLSFTKK